MSSATIPSWYRLEAVDAWFFRDGKPFNRGEDQGDFRSLFPPAASTTIGMIRYALAIENGWNGRGSWRNAEDSNGLSLKKVLGTDAEQTGLLTFSGPLICLNEQPLFTVPRHLIGFEKNALDTGAGFEKVFQALDWLVPSDIGSSDIEEHDKKLLPAPLGMHTADDVGKRPTQPEDFFLTLTGMQEVVVGRLPNCEHFVHRNQLYEVESRVGCERDLQSRSVQEGRLFHPHFIRMRKGVALTVGVSGIPDGWGVPGLVSFGGESRMAGLVPSARLDFSANVGLSSKKVAVILLTPGMFGTQWWGAGPGDEASELSQQLSGTVLTAAIDRPQRIGGWDGVNGKPLPKRPFAPAGSVWWIESASDNLVPGTLVNLGQANHLGYGMAVIAAVSEL